MSKFTSNNQYLTAIQEGNIITPEYFSLLLGGLQDGVYKTYKFSLLNRIHEDVVADAFDAVCPSESREATFDYEAAMNIAQAEAEETASPYKEGMDSKFEDKVEPWINPLLGFKPRKNFIASLLAGDRDPELFEPVAAQLKKDAAIKQLGWLAGNKNNAGRKISAYVKKGSSLLQVAPESMDGLFITRAAEFIRTKWSNDFINDIDQRNADMIGAMLHGSYAVDASEETDDLDFDL